jgi:DNA-binding phage protein
VWYNGWGVGEESFLRSLKDGVGPRWGTIEKILNYLGYEMRFVKKKKGGETD